MMKILSWTALIFLASFLQNCRHENISTQENVTDTHADELGTINIDITCADAAKPYFTEGLLLLHSFQFDDAAEKFQKAQALDSLCAMAYWGEAMTKNHPLWREQDKEEALSILSQLGSTKEAQALKFKEGFERDMYNALVTLYGSGTKKENDLEYAEFMSKLKDKYPDNHEVQAFYALSLLGAIEDDRQESMYNKGARIAQSIIEENPNHPGALHYLIHSYDDPEHAHKALDAAYSYSKVAPDAAHALHMPSHIFVALGMWDEVIASNTKAVAASKERRDRKALPLKAIDFHSLKWWMYGHLQRGEFEEAKQLVLEMKNYCEQESSPKAISHNVMMKAAYCSETNDWSDEILNDDVDYGDVSVQIYATLQYLNAMKAFKNKDAKALESIIQSMNAPIAEAHKTAMSASSSMCSGSYDRARPTLNHVKRAEVYQLQIRALHAMLKNDAASVEANLIAAIEKESTTTYKYGPPEIVKPSYEMYAEWLEQSGNNQEAKKYYTKVLDRAPGRYIPTKAISRLNELI